MANWAKLLAAWSVPVILLAGCGSVASQTDDSRASSARVVLTPIGKQPNAPINLVPRGALHDSHYTEPCIQEGTGDDVLYDFSMWFESTTLLSVYLTNYQRPRTYRVTSGRNSDVKARLYLPARFEPSFANPRGTLTIASDQRRATFSFGFEVVPVSKTKDVKGSISLRARGTFTLHPC